MRRPSVGGETEIKRRHLNWGSPALPEGCVGGHWDSTGNRRPGLCIQARAARPADVWPGAWWAGGSEAFTLRPEGRERVCGSVCGSQRTAGAKVLQEGSGTLQAVQSGQDVVVVMLRDEIRGVHRFSWAETALGFHWQPWREVHKVCV